AIERMAEAGYTVENGVMTGPDGAPFTFKVLISNAASEVETMMDLYTQALDRMGIAVEIDKVDSAQLKERTQAYDYDMIYYRWGLSLSPGNEQMRYWGSAGVEEPGSRNIMGMNSPAAEDMINRLVNSGSQDEFLAAARSLDRVLMSGRYVIPIYQYTASRLAHDAALRFDAGNLPMYGDWIGFQPDVWWYEE
ncbi:MAG: ABC transporter substrate-binding protein, partial [Pseudomonadota bacterium]